MLKASQVMEYTRKTCMECPKQSCILDKKAECTLERVKSLVIGDYQTAQKEKTLVLVRWAEQVDAYEGYGDYGDYDGFLPLSRYI